MLKLDVYDRKLLYQLDANARQSYVQLAKKIGLSKDAVKYRITNYLKTGLLGGFYTLIDASKLGYFSMRVYFSFRNTTANKEEEIIQYLVHQKPVWWIARTDVSCDVAFGVWVKKLSEYHEFWTKFKETYAVYLTNEKQGIFMELHHFNRNYLWKQSPYQTKKTIAEPQAEKIDAIDFQLLTHLAKDARIQITELCSLVDLTPKAVILRIRKLEQKGIILEYKPKINLEKIGYSMYKVDLRINNRAIIKSLRASLFSLPNIIHAQTVIGGTDFEFDVEVMAFDEFNSIISTIKSKFGASIESITYFRTLKIYKTLYLPVAL